MVSVKSKVVAIFVAIVMVMSALAVSGASVNAATYKVVDGVKYKKFKTISGMKCWMAVNYKTKITYARKEKGDRLQVRWTKPKNSVKNYNVSIYGRTVRYTKAYMQYFNRPYSALGGKRNYAKIFFTKYDTKGRNIYYIPSNKVNIPYPRKK